MSTKSSFSPRRRWQIAFDVLLRTALVLAVVVMFNYLGAQFFHRFYLSSQTHTGLSSRTLNVLNSMTNKVTITLYYDTKDQSNFYPTLLALANEYHIADKNISVRSVDYNTDPGEAAKIKQQYGLPGDANSPNSPPTKDLIIFASGDRTPIVIPGAAIVQYKLVQSGQIDTNTMQIPFRRKPVQFNGEVMFTSKLLALANVQPFRAYFLQGDGEGSLADSGDYGFLKFALELAQNNIWAQNLDLSGGAPVPMDCNLLIIAPPKGSFSPTELQTISKYLAEGGRLFVMFNFNSITAPNGLETVIQSWGVNILPYEVKDVRNTITGQDVRVNQFNQKSFLNPLTGLSLQMILPRPVAAVNWASPPANAPQVTELAFSDGGSTLTEDPATMPRSYPLIASVEQKPAAGVMTSRGTTRIIVVGDSYFLGNHYIEGGGGGGNRDFVSYAANWLLDREVLLAGIAPRPVTEYYLQITRKEQWQLNWLLLGALPGGVLILGWFVWLVRRK